jgi:alkylhydroperoxidase family enzyme
LQDPTAEADRTRECLMRAELDPAPLAPPERALLRFVETVTRHAHRTTDEDVEALRQHGWTDPQIAECVYIAALFAFFNRVADAFGLADPGYFASGPPPGLVERHAPEEPAG